MRYDLGARASRRGLLTGALGLGATAVLAACGGSDDETPSASGSSAAAGPFTYTDGRGRPISLPKTPTKIVAQVGAAAALWDFGVRPIGIFGPSTKADGTQDPQSGSIDLKAVTSVGNVYGEFNIEKYLSLSPELLIAGMYDPKLLWYVPEESEAQIEQIAPTLGVQLTAVDLVKAIGLYEELAGKLGANLGTPELAAAKAAFQAADEAVKTAGAAATAAGLRVAAFSGSKDVLYMSVPKYSPDLSHYLAQGVPLTVPAKPDGPDAWWESLSWENAAKYPIDVILYDARTQALPHTELVKTQPAFAALPAVKAGQIIDWFSEAQYSYQGYTPQLTNLAAKLPTFKKVA
ncbi:ABC transporter substrate-binding protein [Catenuloplanes atrovinosus]|uniref:Iron complex transport system substrate-binding protein n=1 Tax=Catenuloplanes atrovinosus TaxID=137266 RepID=A0AAE4C9F6_9ACTN|nr:ABC transporter substrate-binding protein [Catenuloplanes atrovinosus]MDR7273540.1 iron complex transport system substrate-binding protein [Catenuloplanes atrovinosus]